MTQRAVIGNEIYSIVRRTTSVIKLRQEA